MYKFYACLLFFHFCKRPEPFGNGALDVCIIHDDVGPGGGAVKYEMDTGVRAALRQAGAFSESTGSKNEGSLGESMIFGIQ